ESTNNVRRSASAGNRVMNCPRLGWSGSAATIPCWKLTRQSSNPACRRRPRRIWAPVRTWMPSVTEGKDEGEAEDANQDLAVPRRRQTSEHGLLIYRPSGAETLAHRASQRP